VSNPGGTPIPGGLPDGRPPGPTRLLPGAKYSRRCTWAMPVLNQQLARYRCSAGWLGVSMAAKAVNASSASLGLPIYM
jgi:hypothetical protein